jgi:hypothetical protein
MISAAVEGTFSLFDRGNRAFSISSLRERQMSSYLP